jgi:hypothetical protein
MDVLKFQLHMPRHTWFGFRAVFNASNSSYMRYRGDTYMHTCRLSSIYATTLTSLRCCGGAVSAWVNSSPSLRLNQPLH